MTIVDEKMDFDFSRLSDDTKMNLIYAAVLIVPPVIAGCIKLFISAIAKIQETIKNHKIKKENISEYNKTVRVLTNAANDANKMFDSITQIKSALKNFAKTTIYIPEKYYYDFIQYKKIEGEYVYKKMINIINLLSMEKGNIALSKNIHTYSLKEYTERYIPRINTSYQKFLSIEEECELHSSTFLPIKNDNTGANKLIDVDELSSLLTISENDIMIFKRLCTILDELTEINKGFKIRKNLSADDYYSYFQELIVSTSTVMEKFIDYTNNILAIFNYIKFSDK
jgi:hypothetical protein